MKIHLTSDEVDEAIKYWLRHQMDVDTDVEVRKTSEYLYPYEVETNSDLFYQEPKGSCIVKSNFKIADG